MFVFDQQVAVNLRGLSLCTYTEVIFFHLFTGIPVKASF